MMKTILLLAAVALVQARPDEGLERSNACPADVFGIVPHESDCSKFYMCVQGVKVELACASGTLYNPELQVCDWAPNVQCSSTVVRLSGSSDNNDELPRLYEPVSRSICPANFFGFWPHEYDCSKYYLCIYGTDIDMVCGSGLHFSATMQLCVHPSAAGCTLPGPTEGPEPSTTHASDTTDITTPSTSAPDVTAGPDNYEILDNGCPANFSIHKLLPHEEFCHKFYQCDNGQLVSRYCAVGTYFNPELEVCDWPFNVDCVNDGPYEYPSTSLPEVEPPVTPEDSDIGDVLDNGCPANFEVHYLLRHESECNKFYYCVAGQKVERSCPAGLLFNYGIQVCDWPQFVNCQL